MPISEQDKKELKDLLEEKKLSLEEQLEHLPKMMEYGDDVDSFDEETDESEAQANLTAVGETLKHHINHIDDALDRMESGTYGKCKECGQEISVNLLKVVPESLLCQNCKVKLNKTK